MERPLNKMTITDIQVKGKRVLVRVDFNVPMNEKSQVILDDTRIKAALPTIMYLCKEGAKVILCSHLGEPNGKVIDTLRLSPVGKRLSVITDKKVICADDCIGPEVEEVVGKLAFGDILLLENLRFHSEEKTNDPGFAQSLSRLADIYVNEAFGTLHRSHASIVGITKFLPAVAGFLVEKELEKLGSVLDKPIRPLGAIIGGAKVGDKISLIENMLEKVNYLFIGGGMVSTFLKVQGYEIGNSLVEDDKLKLADIIMNKAINKGVHLFLPVDLLISDSFTADSTYKNVTVDKILPQWYIMDIGKSTIEKYKKALGNCRTILWNGPMGVYEFTNFSNGTSSIANLLATLKNAITIIGGGSTAEAINKLGLTDKMTHVSTGGGASLKVLEGATLPGLSALMDKQI